jgi:hypothetical protein
VRAHRRHRHVRILPAVEQPLEKPLAEQDRAVGIVQARGRRRVGIRAIVVVDAKPGRTMNSSEILASVCASAMSKSRSPEFEIIGSLPVS